MVRFNQEVDNAVDALLLQQVILYPTDTVWGLGCDAEAPPAVQGALQTQGPAGAGQPSIVLVADVAMLKRYAAEVPAELEALIAVRYPADYLYPARRAGRGPGNWWPPTARWACAW